MTTKVKNKEDLPPWFILETYNRENNYKLPDWLHSFESRLQLQNMLDKGETYSNQDKLREKISKKIEHHHKGITPSIWHKKLTNYNDTPIRLHSTKSVVQFNPIERDKNINQFYEGFKRNPDKYNTSKHLINFFKKQLNDDIAFLEVDTRSSDNQLKEEFELWLKAYRNQMPATKNTDINQATINKWINFRLLAYIDLIQWAKYENTTITSALIRDFLYPQEPIDDSRIKTTLPTLMKETLSHSFLHKLNSKATSEGYIGMPFGMPWK